MSSAGGSGLATITPPPLPDTTGDCTGVPIGVPPGVDTEKSVGRELIVDRRIALMLDRPAYETDDEESRRFTVFKENLVFIDKVGVEARASTRRARARAAFAAMALSGAGTRAPLSS